jgi:hypothetical protein
MRALAALSKFIGHYDIWKEIIERYQLTWSIKGGTETFNYLSPEFKFVHPSCNEANYHYVESRLIVFSFYLKVKGLRLLAFLINSADFLYKGTKPVEIAKEQFLLESKIQRLTEAPEERRGSEIINIRFRLDALFLQVCVFHYSVVYILSQFQILHCICYT